MTKQQDVSWQRVRYRQIAAVVGLVLVLFASGISAAPLDDYVARTESDFQYEILSDQTGSDGFRVLQIRMTSQRWQNLVWRHRLMLVIPPQVESDAALVYVSGSGSGNDELMAVKQLAGLVKAPAAALMDIPNQPLFAGLNEDALIAYTFTQFVQTQDPSWLLLFPMTKGTTKAMDVIEDVTGDVLGKATSKFVVTGASKRGWTTWLTGAVDDRVVGIAPIVYNNLDLIAQMELHGRTYPQGASPKIADYTNAGFVELVNSPMGSALAEQVDPYAYLDRLTMPKLLLHGTNDPYWPVDALNIYLGDLLGETFVVNFANGGHSLGDLPRAIRSIAALFVHATAQPVLPQIEWNVEETDEGRLVLHVKQGSGAQNAVLWVATSPTRDFTHAQWSELRATVEGDEWVARPLGIDGRYLAFYMDVEYAVLPGETLRLSTPIFVMGPR